MINYIKKVFQDMIDQLWTLLGMFIAWVVLDGSAKTVVGYAIICTLIAWAITYPIRNKGDE
jgi:ABC-type multidrug transport system permease subunit